MPNVSGAAFSQCVDARELARTDLDGVPEQLCLAHVLETCATAAATASSTGLSR